MNWKFIRNVDYVVTIMYLVLTILLGYEMLTCLMIVLLLGFIGVYFVYEPGYSTLKIMSGLQIVLIFIEPLARNIPKWMTVSAAAGLIMFAFDLLIVLLGMDCIKKCVYPNPVTIKKIQADIVLKLVMNSLFLVIGGIWIFSPAFLLFILWELFFLIAEIFLILALVQVNRIKYCRK